MVYGLRQFLQQATNLPTHSLQATVPSHVTFSISKETRTEHSQHVTCSPARTQIFNKVSGSFPATRSAARCRRNTMGYRLCCDSFQCNQAQRLCVFDASVDRLRRDQQQPVARSNAELMTSSDDVKWQLHIIEQCRRPECVTVALVADGKVGVVCQTIGQYG